MLVRFVQTDKRLATNAFTLIEILISFVILSLVMSGLMYGYVQANRVAEWSAISLAAQSYASQGAEQLRAADWRPRDPYTNHGPNTGMGNMARILGDQHRSFGCSNKRESCYERLRLFCHEYRLGNRTFN